MEFINRIELKGIVGSAVVSRVGGSKVFRFSLATEHAYEGSDGTTAIDRTWFQVTAHEGAGIPDLGSVRRGSGLLVRGRIKCSMYVDANGNDRVMYEVVAGEVEMADGE